MTKPQAAGKAVSGTDGLPPAEPQVTIYVVNGTRTSARPGPGPKVLPASEANLLLGARLAVYGDRAPNEPDPEPVVRRFGSPPPPPTTRQHSN